MEEMSTSKFKATCLAVLERVRQTRAPILITKRGRVIAEIRPPPVTGKGQWLGSMAGTIEIVGDICDTPAEELATWESLR